MCGRFLSLSKEDWQELLQEAYDESKIPPISQDIYPSQSYLVKTNTGFQMMHWGIEPSWKKMRIINARVETVQEKAMFRKLYQAQRCIIYVKAFYEWDKQKHQYIVDKPNEKVLALAGFYEKKEGQSEFVIMTQAAPKSFMHIHDRLPCMLYKEMQTAYTNGVTLDNQQYQQQLVNIAWKDISNL
ncbi:hypothetical protein A4S06_01715 [Erysipelotrichaceae bacterium MTC7]|nr:hypothetical protein A4S06_01715 [Erysipelotrichaceae bacterium MTC7]